MLAPLALRRALARPSTASRSLHLSATTLRKARPAETAFDDADADASDDLFDTLDAAPSSSSGSRADRRAALAASIVRVARLPPHAQRPAAAHARVGELRRVVQLTDAGEADALRGVLKAWRASGRRVTGKTAEEIVDLAKEFAEDKLQYGLPELPAQTLAKLQTQ